MWYFYIDGNHSSTSGAKGIYSKCKNVRIGSGRVNGYETKFDLSHNKSANYPAFWGNQAADQSISSATYTALNDLDSNDHGTEHGFNKATGKFTVPDDGAGLYFFCAGGAIKELDENDIVRMRFYKNGSSIGAIGEARQYSSDTTNVAVRGATVQGIFKLNAGDYVEARIYQNESDNSTRNTDDAYCWFGGFRIASH